MTAAHLTADGYALRSLKLWMPAAGVWSAEFEYLEQPVSPPSAVTLQIGTTTLRGTVTQLQGNAALTRSAIIVGGNGRWGTALAAKSYHNDAGVRAELIARDIASEAGESLGDFAPSADVLGVDYVRQAQSASKALNYAAGTAAWWVDYAGVTQVGVRPTAALAARAYQLLSYDVVARVAELELDDLATFGVGSVITDDRVDAPLIVREFVLTASDKHALRVRAWCVPTGSGQSRLAGLVRQLVRQMERHELAGVYRYRVVSEGVDKRLTLQSVRSESGLPDVKLVSQWPGAPGVYPALTPGSEVLVQFVEGDPSQPVVTGYVGPDGALFAPAGLTIGDSAGEPAARLGDLVEVLIPPAVFTGTVNGLPATGNITWLAPKAAGSIISGSTRVRIAT